MRPTVKLWEICDILDKKRKPITQKDRTKWIYPYYWASWVLDYVADYIFDEDLVLIWEDWAKRWALDNSAFKVSWKVWVNNHAHVIRPHREKILDDFLVYFLVSNDLSDYITWTTVPKLNQERLKLIEIPLPSLETQKAIVAKLDQIFAELDQTKSEIQKNLDNTDELWKSALNQAFQGDWEMKKLDNIVDFSQWIQVPIEDQSMVEKPWLVRFLRIIDFTQWWQEPRYVENFWDRYHVNNDDLSMVRYGATTWFICSWMEWIIANNLFKITPKKENILKKYLYVYFKSPYFDRFLQKEVFWAAMPAISFWTLKNVEIPVPPLSEQEKIVEHLDQVSKEVKALKSQYQSQLDNLEELKKSVLDKAFRWEMG